MTKIFPSLLNLLSPAGTYWLLASIAASSNIFYAFFMPETKGKSPLEVKQIFMKNWSRFTNTYIQQFEEVLISPKTDKKTALVDFLFFP